MKHLTSLFSLPLAASLLFATAKLIGLWPLSGWSWGWVFSPLWVEWLTTVAVRWVSRMLIWTLRFGMSFLVFFYGVSSLSSSTNIGSDAKSSAS